MLALQILSFHILLIKEVQLKGKIITIDGKSYNSYEINTGKQVAVIEEYIPTQEEIEQSQLQQAKQQRITELKTLIDNKRYLGDDVTAEQTELRELLGL